jgi:TIR domain-containing protein
VKVFISWSGDYSHRLAEFLREWLPDVIQDLEPWVSSEDIAKGKRWNEELARSLDEVHQGIICVTPDNMHSPWLNFEAGALAKRLEGSTGGQVRPILLGVRPADVTGPLASFQATEATKSDDILKLLQSLDQTGIDGRSKLGEQRLNRYFGMNWPVLRDRVDELLRMMTEQEDKPIDPPEKTARDQDDMLAELLEAVRRLERRADQSPPAHSVTTLTSGTLARSTQPFSVDVSSIDPSLISGRYRLGESIFQPRLTPDLKIEGGNLLVGTDATGKLVLRAADESRETEETDNEEK